jgi:hypothetical protein
MNASDPLAPVDPLDALRERARAPGASPEHLRALLTECARPLMPHEDVLARIRALSRLLEDPVLGAARAGDSPRVDVAAARALNVLGVPYLQALSPEARRVLERVRAEHVPPPRRPRPPEAWRGDHTLGVLTGFVLEVVLVMVAASQSIFDLDGALLMGGLWAAVAGIQLGPALLVLRARSAHPVLRAVVGYITLAWALGLLYFAWVLLFAGIPAWIVWSQVMLLAGGLLRLWMASRLGARLHGLVWTPPKQGRRPDEGG